MAESFEENQEWEPEHKEKNRAKNTIWINSGISKAISFSVVLIGIAIFYYYVIFLPKHEQAKLDFQREQELQQIEQQKFEKRLADEKEEFNRTMLQACLDDAEVGYTNWWDKNCQSRGLKSDCTLPATLAENINDARKEAKDFCFKKYP